MDDILSGIFQALPVLAAGFTKNPDTVTRTAGMMQLGQADAEKRRKQAFAQEIFSQAKAGAELGEREVFGIAEKYGVAPEEAFTFIEKFMAYKAMKESEAEKIAGQPLKDAMRTEQMAQLQDASTQRATKQDVVSRLKDLMGHEAGTLVGPTQATNRPEMVQDILGSGLDDAHKFAADRFGQPAVNEALGIPSEPGYFEKKIFEHGLDQEKARFTAGLKQPELVKIETIDPKTGEPVVRFVPKDPSASYPAYKSGMDIETGPDGTVIRTNSSRGAGSPQYPWTKPTTTELEKKVIATDTALQRIGDIEKAFKPEYLTYGGRGKAAAYREYEKFGNELAPESKKYLEGYNTFMQKAIEDINLYIKELTGAQMSREEAERLLLAKANPGFKWMDFNSPSEFMRRIKNDKEKIRLAGIRYKMLLTGGMTAMEASSMIKDGRATPLENIPALFKKRVAEIEQEESNRGLSDKLLEQAVDRRIKQEFGL